MKLNERFSWLNALLSKLPGKTGKTAPQQKPIFTKITRENHSVSRKQISHNALKVIYRLQDGGYEAYLVGGCIRDLLLGKQPKDFDVVTSATPEEARRLFRNSRLIGRRFKLVHVQFGREIIEVATFRAHHSTHNELDQTSSKHALQAESGRILRDNVYGSIEDDAMRRDFTMNALYYTTRGFAIHDYANGVKDIKARTVRLIGDPTTRYQEDPVRMLRAIRFAAKLDFTIERSTAAPIPALADLLRDIPSARLFDEVLKLFLGGAAEQTFTMLREYGLFKQLFPMTDALIDQDDGFGLRFITLILKNTDQRIRQNKTVHPAFLFAALLWVPMVHYAHDIRHQGVPPIPAMIQAGLHVIDSQSAHTAIPKRFAIPMREIWELQHRLTVRHGKRTEATLNHPRFRAGYDFLLIREQAGEQLDNLGQWWSQYQQGNEQQRRQMLKKLNPQPRKRRRPSHRRRPSPHSKPSA
ncbi:polynucleotide adenylyltransferase PcnB [Zooshikella marina]|uniref:polynucleotide adenylyltransferase PcnB n=1 Tax=Zooshikella ganghwensis TaxID=202772 RepID=UPI001BAF46DD|nr:polynucleotide adenylyltransferase PcnB [Zooshikella ganghwensis]MBU2707752.1 polynucleotide adenylyltransferase PcnB [Zooshikella ganghwensis]